MNLTNLELFLLLYLLPAMVLHYAMFINVHYDKNLNSSERYAPTTEYNNGVVLCYLPLINLSLFLIGAGFITLTMLLFVYTSLIEPILYKRIF